MAVLTKQLSSHFPIVNQKPMFWLQNSQRTTTAHGCVIALIEWRDYSIATDRENVRHVIVDSFFARSSHLSAKKIQLRLQFGECQLENLEIRTC